MHNLNQQWANFNYTEYPPESKETIPQALEFIVRLINCNAPALKITATPTTTFRTWFLISRDIY